MQNSLESYKMKIAQYLLILNSLFILACVLTISYSDCLDILYSVKEKFDYKILTKFNEKGNFV